MTAAPPRATSRFRPGVIVAVVLVFALVLALVAGVFAGVGEHAVHVDVVEDCQAEVVGPNVLTLIEHDLDARDRDATDVHDLTPVRLIRCEGEDRAVSPAEADPAKAVELARGGCGS